ncbi:MAG: Sua5/YciO/YrdC/YwlC family protein, partial [Mycobacterium leprae]
FHLACDAGNESAVRLLRDRKRRPHRPFAVMARDLETVRRVCTVSAAEEQQLTSPAAPILLLPYSGGGIAPSVAPGLNTLGVMLPYTPLHLLLLQAGPPVLVMTSGNPSGLPLCIDEAEAYAYLGHIADAFLIHNRPIHVPCDDSVLQVSGGEPFFLRRSRGYVPRPIVVSGGEGPAWLGVGGEIKNTFCLLSGERAVFSQHLGDQVSEEARANFLRALASMERLTGIEPEGVAYDMHPGYRSTALARELPLGRKVAVQHHHAHLAACMADNRLDDEVIGLVLDGTGYGTDGAIWGFEVLAGGFTDFRRIAHLAYSPLPGSEAAIHQPLMAAAGLVAAHLGEAGLDRLTALVEGATFCGSGSPAGAGGSAREVAVARAMIRSGLNCPPAGTAGRLFDGVSALLGICRRQTYEGQAAIELGAVADSGPAYPVGLKDDLIDPGLLLDGLLTDLGRGMPREYLAGRFLSTVAAMAVTGAEAARTATGLNRVCLSGGTFQSAWLLAAVSDGLTAKGFDVYRHRAVPPGDGGIALGQAMIARRRWQLGCV